MIPKRILPMKFRIYLAASIIFISSCTGSKKTTSSVDAMKPTEADVQKQVQAGVNTDLATLVNGYSLYTANCGTCHKLFEPSQKSMDQWNGILPQMFPKTKLSVTEQANVRAYIVAKN
jgi:hypothetical protein